MYANLVKSYLDYLKQFNSPENAEETQRLERLYELMHQIRNTLRYQPQHYDQLPELIHQLEQVETEETIEHPAYSAALHMLQALKETEEYAALSFDAKSRAPKK